MSWPGRLARQDGRVTRPDRAGTGEYPDPSHLHSLTLVSRAVAAQGERNAPHAGDPGRQPAAHRQFGVGGGGGPGLGGIGLGQVAEASAGTGRAGWLVGLAIGEGSIGGGQAQERPGVAAAERAVEHHGVALGDRLVDLPASVRERRRQGAHGPGHAPQALGGTGGASWLIMSGCTSSASPASSTAGNTSSSVRRAAPGPGRPDPPGHPGHRPPAVPGPRLRRDDPGRHRPGRECRRGNHLPGLRRQGRAVQGRDPGRRGRRRQPRPGPGRTAPGHRGGLLADRGVLRPDLSVEEARDLLWTLNSLAVHDLLVLQCGWSPERYRDWLAGALARELLPDRRSHPGRPSR
jgi:hypothetical protein